MDKRGLIDDIFRDMVTDYSKSSVQEELKEVLTKMPADFRDSVETRELRLEGIVYFNNSYPFFEWNAVKVAYIYGERYLEKAIEEAATKMVAADLLMSDDRSVLIPEGTQNVDIGAKVQLLRQEAEAILRRYTEIVVFE